MGAAETQKMRASVPETLAGYKRAQRGCYKNGTALGFAP